ncbi:MAG: hypothetical protein L3J41_09735 [Melioribacteraceae bacterium]|nr:hypothetical protein [Melioribacteraceae bacterium]
MSGTVRNIEEIKLGNTKNGRISISIVDKPYGEKSESVVSIGVLLQEKSDEPNWKVHIPKENIDAVISALERAKESL